MAPENVDERTAPEPVRAGGLLGKVMADIQARAREYRARESTGSKRREIKPSATELSTQRKAELRGLPESKWGVTFESFDLKAAPRMHAAYEATLDIAVGRWKTWCLVLSGKYGTGKTHLAYAAANVCRVRETPYRMITAPALMAQLKNSIDEKRRSIEAMAPTAYGPEEWVKVYSETKALLILDDFGAQQDTEWATAQLFAILNARYDAGLPTLITTNLGATQIDPRIASRCAAGIIVCSGPDQRLKYS